MMNTFFIIDKFNGVHKWTPQLLEKLPPYKFQTKFHAPDGRLTSLQCTGKLFCCFRGIRDTKIEKSRGIQDKTSL